MLNKMVARNHGYAFLWINPLKSMKLIGFSTTNIIRIFLTEMIEEPRVFRVADKLRLCYRRQGDDSRLIQIYSSVTIQLSEFLRSLETIHDGHVKIQENEVIGGTTPMLSNHCLYSGLPIHFSVDFNVHLGIHEKLGKHEQVVRRIIDYKDPNLRPGMKLQPHLISDVKACPIISLS